jgi:hypothetical protein
MDKIGLLLFLNAIMNDISRSSYSIITPMANNLMHLDTQRTRIHKDLYRPSANILRVFKTVITVIMHGQSPVGINYSKRKFH